MKIEIVTHCYAAKYPHYAQALCYKLSQLVLNPPSCNVAVTICYNELDCLTNQVIDWFETKLKLYHMRLPVPYLGRRCIGRNYAARSTNANVVWFDDVDQVYTKECLETLAEMTWPYGAVMVYPKIIQIHQDHVTGDQVTGLITEPQLKDIDKTLFIEKKYNRAIGGIQIVQGEFAREFGYLDGDRKWQQPRLDNNPFGDFRDDIAYRSFCQTKGTIVGIDLPGVFRIRHTHTSYQPPKTIQ